MMGEILRFFAYLTGKNFWLHIFFSYDILYYVECVSYVFHTQRQPYKIYRSASLKYIRYINICFHHLLSFSHGREPAMKEVLFLLFLPFIEPQPMINENNYTRSELKKYGLLSLSHTHTIAM